LLHCLYWHCFCNAFSGNVRLVRHYDGFEMTHIEAIAANIGLGGPGEPSVEAEAALSPEALALFSSLFVQMQPEIEGTAETASQPAGPADALSVAGGLTPLDITVSQENSDAGAIDLGDMTNLTELLVAAQQIVGTDSVAAEVPATAIDRSIFTDAPIAETTAIATQLIQQAAAALIERRQLIEGAENPAPRAAYDAEALSNPQLAALLKAVGQPMLRDSVKQVLPDDDAVTAAPEAIIGFDSQIVTVSAPALPLADAVPTALQGPPQPSGQGPVPVQLAHLVQGPPQKSGQGPTVLPVIKHLQGPPQASGQGPVMPELAKQLQGPPQASGQGPVIPELAKQLQGPPQASGPGPVMPELAKQLQHPPQASGQRPQSVQLPLAGADRLAATPQMAQPAITKGGVATVSTNESTLSDEVALATGLKTEVIEKSEIKFEIRPGQKMPDGSRNDRVMTPADAVMQTAHRAAAQSMSQMNATPSRVVTPPMMIDLARQIAADASSDSNNQPQQLATSSASTTQQQGGQSNGNGPGQQGRDAQPGVVDSGAKNAGGERVATYRLNVQQNGWADTMVRRLQTSLQNGSAAVRIILEPRNLGRLQVTMGLRDGRAAIRIAADTTQAAGLLRDSRAQLAQMFEQSGLRLANMQTTTAILNGDGGATADDGGSQMFAEQQTSGQNANKDGKNSEHGNKLLSDGADAVDIEIDTTTVLAPGETAVLNVLA
jgi:flagellar hook-length control protein FliK